MKFIARLTLLFFLILIGLMIALCFSILSRDQIRFHFDTIQTWWMKCACSILGVKITCTGPALITQGLMVSNHISWLDILIIGSQTPARFVAKSDVKRWPIIGALVSGAGTLYVDRGRHANQKNVHYVGNAVQQCINHGGSVCLFPEGTTSDGSSVKRYASRFLTSAANHTTPLQPIAIVYGLGVRAVVPFIDADDFFSHLLRILNLPEIPVHLSVANPFSPVGDINVTSAYCREWTQRVIDLHRLQEPSLDAEAEAEAEAEAKLSTPCTQ